MKRINLALALIATAATATVAVLGFGAPAAQAQVPAVTTDYIVHAKDRPKFIVHSWARNGKFQSVFPGDKTEVPYDAAKIHVAMFAFPNGMVRPIYFDAATRTHPNINHDDTIFYQISGRRIQVINDDAMVVNPGDVSIQMSGVRKRMDQLIGGDMVEFAIPHPHYAETKPIWIKADEVKPVTVDGYQLKTFKIHTYELKEARLPKGAKMARATDKNDTYFYLVSGSVKAHIGDVKDTVLKESAMQAPAGVPFSFEALEDSLLVYAAYPTPAVHK